MKLNPDIKAQRARERLLAKAAEYQIGTYAAQFVAVDFQKMIRAEAGADRRAYVPAVMGGAIRQIERRVGQCVCITCGIVKNWDAGIKHLHTGHFIQGRRASILLDEDNVAPQCAHCNYYCGGRQQAFRQWLIATKGQDTVDRLVALKSETRTFERAELVDMLIQFRARLKAAKAAMKGV